MSKPAASVPYIRLGVNVDHVATIRQARRGREPDPVAAAHASELGGADQITIHLREDRRHIQERDFRLLRETTKTRLNLELAVADEVLDICIAVRPEQATLVPERRQEVTTEGGLDVKGQLAAVSKAVERLKKAGIRPSLFIDPDEAQVEASKKAGAESVELHTGAYAHAWIEGPYEKERERLERAGARAVALGLGFYAGHGLDYVNIQRVRDLPGLEEVNIGHAIISRAIFVGLETAVRQMKQLLS
ncbi:MAG: pyridoxine 5'-phosphate synthase [Planctomycetota bacterium]